MKMIPLMMGSSGRRRCFSCANLFFFCLSLPSYSSSSRITSGADVLSSDREANGRSKKRITLTQCIWERNKFNNNLTIIYLLPDS
jgi:hypothetical protein